MKKKFFILIVGLAWMLLAGDLLAKGPAGSQSVSFNKPGQGETIQTVANLCNWAFWVRNDGYSGQNPFTEASGGTYPRGTATIVFQDGFIFGGKVTQSHFAQPEGSYRVGGQTYSIGTAAGHIEVAGTTTTPPVASNPNNAFIYRIRKDWESLALDQPTVIADAADVLNKSQSAVTTADQQKIISDYRWSWENWPVHLGAPYYDHNGNGAYDPGVDEPGIANADQVIWFVFNDVNAGLTTQLYGSQPIGVEVQTTMWTYNQAGGSLGQIIFKSSLLINKSGFPIDSMFVAQWCDPDVGVYTDDLVGCDSVKSLGYAYSGNLTDDDYLAFNLPPAAMGYDFFQGPIVAGAAEDTAIFGLQYRPGFRNLPQYSFGYFAAGSAISDPDLGEYAGTLQWYNLLNGFIPTEDTLNPSPFTHGFGPMAGHPTKFPVNGDPVGNTGDLDAFGNNLPPGDRRMSLSSGPFRMEPGDSQEVVVAIVGGIVAQAGGNNRNAVAQLKLNDDFAQFIFDRLFQGIPSPPAAPDVKVTPLDDKITLEWGSNQARVAQTEALDLLLGYNFEGYNIYQYSSETRSDARKVATFDLANNITQINGERFVPEFGDIVTVPIQKGTDTGIQRYFVLEKDYVNDRPLYAGNTYYFAVTAYNAKDLDGNGIVDDDVPEPSLESAPEVIIVKPQSTAPGVVYGGTAAEILEVDRSLSESDGIVQARVVDPSRTTGHTYEIFFADYMNPDSSIELRWNVRDKDLGTVIITNQRQAASVDAPDIDKPIADGVEFIVTGPELTFKRFYVVANGAGPLDPFDMGAFAFNNNGFPTLDGLPAASDGSNDRPRFGYQQSTNNSGWGIHTGYTGASNNASFDYFITRVTQAGARWPLIIPNDFEIRFTAGPNWGFEPNAFITGAGTGGTAMQVPFELWYIGAGTPDDPNDDYRLFPYLIDSEADGGFNLAAIDHPVSGGADDPETDWFYWAIPADQTPGQAGYEAIVNEITTNPDAHEYLGPLTAGTDVMRRMVLVSWNGGSVTDPTFPANQRAVMPEEGTVFRIISSKPNKDSDVFSVKAPAVTYSDDQAKQDVERINVFPNPYYAFNSEESDRFDRKVTFTHLPRKATIRIFSLAGTLVRKIEKDNADQFQDWDLRNETSLPVASGMYIVHIQLPDLGKEKTLKLFVAQGAEILRFF